MVDEQLGWGAVEELLSASEVASILGSTDALLLLPPEERRAGDKPVSGTRHLEELDDRIPLVAEVLARTRLLAVVEGLVGAEPRRSQVSLRDPQPGYGAQKLHADGTAKLKPGPATVATAIIALVDFEPGNGATRVVPGSHQRPDLQRIGGSLDEHRDEIVLTGLAGTAFVFDGHLLHSGRRNDSKHGRPALQVLWHRQDNGGF